MNKVVLVGNITRDPEMHTTQSGITSATFDLAVQRPYKRNGERETDFIRCVAWRQNADFAGKYIKKGFRLCVCGSIQTRSYTAQDGGKRYVTEVIVDQLENLTPRQRDDEFVEVNDEQLPF